MELSIPWISGLLPITKYVIQTIQQSFFERKQYVLTVVESRRNDFVHYTSSRRPRRGRSRTLPGEIQLCNSLRFV